jgi:methyl-accepting chemotaxis protein
MSYLRSLKVSAQLLAGFAIILVLLAGLGVFGLSEIGGENGHVVAMRDNWLPSVEAAGELAAALDEVRIAQSLIADSRDAASLQKGQDALDQALAGWKAASDAYVQNISEPEEKTAWAEIQRLLPQYLAYNQQIHDLAAAGKTDEAVALVSGDVRAMRLDIVKQITTIVEVNVAGSKREGEAAANAYSRAVTLVIAVIVLAVLLGAAVAVLISRSITGQLGAEPAEASELASQIAGGNLAAVFRTRAGDTTSLMYSLVTMKNQLEEIVLGIKTSSEAITVASSQIAAGNTDLSSRTEEQAASLEETAASMEELTGTVGQNTEHARQAAAMAGVASEVASRGGEAVSKAVETMEGIAQSSSKVAEIITTIESIAFQTNILALNAAVEAARAGEQGRGFAVVAAEVRTLAQRSATASKEIKDLISESVERVDAGSKQVNDAGNTIHEIVTQVTKVTDLVREIAAASEEQSKGISQVNQAVAQMDQVTQQNAALVEQAAAAALSMNQQAEALRDAVSVFRVSESGLRTVPAARVVATAKARAVNTMDWAA